MTALNRLFADLRRYFALINAYLLGHWSCGPAFVLKVCCLREPSYQVSGPEGETNGRPSGAKTESWLHYNVFQCIGAVVVAPWLLLDRG